MSKHDDTLQVCIEAYGDNWQAYHAAAEIAYFEQTGSLPEWAVFIERIERQGITTTIVHRDPKAFM